MQRITITIDDSLLETLDAVVQRRGYSSRSDAVRDIIRDAATKEASSMDAVPCVAVLGYVYDHETRALAQRLTQALHDHHDLAVAGMHVHLDHESCLEVSVLKGSAAAVRGLADVLTAQRGVRHANLHMVPVRVSNARHDHGSGVATHSHVHA
ncbi:MAG TPA: nickel-responsive transcriptional regulator NikR [Acetobacteraceae bacterium]|jgi:CopG family nickel-responsive transcriptional regulator|nr:nickel-responsive transcriptional regulator NikR [Acetobacteraceae bacterium]